MRGERAQQATLRLAATSRLDLDVLAHELFVMQLFADNNMHHAEREGRVSAWVNGEVPIGALRCARFVGIYDDKFRSIAAGFFDEEWKLQGEGK